MWWWWCGSIDDKKAGGQRLEEKDRAGKKGFIISTHGNKTNRPTTKKTKEQQEQRMHTYSTQTYIHTYPGPLPLLPLLVRARQCLHIHQTYIHSLHIQQTKQTYIHSLHIQQTYIHTLAPSSSPCW